MRIAGTYTVNTDEDRLKLIASIIEKGSIDPDIRQLTLRILEDYGAPEKDGAAEVAAVFDWVKGNIAYRGDPICRDGYHSPKRIVELAAGDCDDHTILLASMLGSVGFPIGAKIVSAEPDMPFHHIYAIVNVRSIGWLALDSTNKAYRVGEEPRYAKARSFAFDCSR